MSLEVEEKTDRLTAMLESEGFDAVLLNAQHNFAWLTGGGLNGIDLSRENGAASLLVTRDGGRFVVANNIEMPRMLAEEVSGEDFGQIEFSWHDEKAAGDISLKRAREIVGRDARVATDIALFADATPIENKIAACRYQLTGAEIERYRLFGHNAGSAIRRVIDKLSRDESELEVAEKIRHEFASDGMAPVVVLVAADERISQFRHPVPTANRWNKTLLLVICSKRRGLITSLSRLVCLGDVPDELKLKTEANAYVNACMLDATRPDATGAEIYAAAANAYAAMGYADEINRHHQGGAAGYRTREWVAHPQSSETVHAGQAFAWNPSITGTKVEETCITTENGVEIITTSPDFPQIATMVNGREYISPGIMSI